MENLDIDLSNICEVKISYNPVIKSQDRPIINSSKSTYDILIRTWDESIIEYLEQFKIVLLNPKNRVLGISTISTGGQSATYVDAKIVFTTALKAGATAIILAHNHPSGSLKPSTQDINLTIKLKEIGNSLDLQVYDHLIISPDGYLSLADEGLM